MLLGETIAFLSFLLFAEVVGTIGGFGSSMLVMPIASWFLPFDQALGLTATFHVFSNGAKLLLFRKGMDKRLLLWLGVPAVIGVIIGARLTVHLDERLLSLVLGVLLLIIGLGLLWKEQWKLRATNANALAGGAISGFTAGVAGTGGAVRGITLTAFALEKGAFVSTSAWIDMGVDLSRTVVYSAQGFVTREVLIYLPALAAIGLLGSWLGKLALARIDQGHFRRIVLGLVIVMGIVSIAEALARN